MSCLCTIISKYDHFFSIVQAKQSTLNWGWGWNEEVVHSLKKRKETELNNVQQDKCIVIFLVLFAILWPIIGLGVIVSTSMNLYYITIFFSNITYSNSISSIFLFFLGKVVYHVKFCRECYFAGHCFDKFKEHFIRIVGQIYTDD